MLIQNGLIFDAVNPTPYAADIRVNDGKITEIAPNLSPVKGETVVNAAGLRVYPGFVDAHSHLGLDNYGMGYEGHDYNEMNDIVACHLRGLDSFNPLERGVRHALEGGVTTVGTGPGSANVLGGTFLAVKTHGVCVDDMVIRESVAMKCAFGENPKRCYQSKGDSARMTTAAKLREMLFNARDYMARMDAAEDASKMPKFDMKMEALLPVLRGEIPLKAHAHRADDICTAIRIAKEFGVKMTLEHCTEGHLIPEIVARSGFPVAVGPTLTNASKIELCNKTFETPGVLHRAGCQVSIITDSPVIPQQNLPMCAALAMDAGLPEEEAWKAITINPAQSIGIADRVGSLEPGKDGDVVIWTADPMHTVAAASAVTIVDGKVVFQR
jgi:imidazolonepropionase-like amidohydrolase